MRNIPLFLLISVLLLSSCSEEITKTKKYYTTYSTQTGSITLQDGIIATVEGNKTSSLAFRSAGIITMLSVLPGDHVKKGQILARLGNREGAIQSSGLSNISQELQHLEQTTNIVKSGVENMSNATSKLYDERIKGLDSNIISLENTLLQAKQNFGNKTNSLTTTFATFAHDFDRIATSMLYEADKILGITTNFEYANDAWEPYLGTRVGDSRALANNEWNTLYALRGKIRAYTETGATIPDINIAIDDLRISYMGARTFAKAMSHMLQNSVIGGGLPEEKLTLWLTTWNTLSSDEQGSESNYISWKNNNLNLTNTSNGSGSAVAEKDITSISLEINTLKQSKNTLLAEKQAKLKEIKTNVDTIESKKGEIQVQLEQTMMNTSLAIESSDYGVIYAPYDGIILEKYMEEGMVIGAGIPLLKISSTDGKMVKIYINNTLYSYSIGDQVYAMLGGEGTKVHTGTISLIQEQIDPIHNKNYTEIKLTGAVTIGEKLTIHLEHTKSNLRNGTIIPLASIITRYGPPGVYILEGDIAHFQLVEIVAADLSYCEVLGIPEGSIIITDGQENIYDGEQLIGEN